MRLSPDEMIFWQHGFVKLNGTIVFTWALMLALALGLSLSAPGGAAAVVVERFIVGLPLISASKTCPATLSFPRRFSRVKSSRTDAEEGVRRRTIGIRKGTEL